jgi:hypothetical protein
VGVGAAAQISLRGCQRIHVSGRSSRNEIQIQGRCMPQRRIVLFSYVDWNRVLLPDHSTTSNCELTIQNCIPYTRRRRALKLPLVLHPPSLGPNGDHSQIGCAMPAAIVTESRGTEEPCRRQTFQPWIILSFTFNASGTHNSPSYCSSIPHLQTEKAASSLIAHLKEEGAGPFLHLCCAVFTLEFSERPAHDA